MGDVHLTGVLRCEAIEQSHRMAEHLPEHIALTRAEPGCISFEVTRTDDPLIWTVTEHFTDSAAFRRHQARASASEWGHQTAGIARDYTISGLTD